jgi:hypothetical protein
MKDYQELNAFRFREKIHLKVLKFINLVNGKDQEIEVEELRGVYDLNVEMFTQGDCVRFAQILNFAFSNMVVDGFSPSISFWSNRHHTITCIEGNFYDVTGEIVLTEEELSEFEKSDIPQLLSKFEGWNYSFIDKGPLV